MHEGKVKYSYVLEGQSHFPFTPKRLRTEEHIFDGSSTVESGSLADNCIENENLVEPGCNIAEDTHAIYDNDSTHYQMRHLEMLKILILLF